MTAQGEVVPLRRKALALLYYLALEGPSTRDRVAELLWGHPGARTNLRSELYHLQRKTQLTFPPRQDPLTLPPEVKLYQSPNGGYRNFLEGLEGLSPEFDEWLSHKRFELESMPTSLSQLEHLGTLTNLPRPGLWIVDAPAGSHVEGLVRELASMYDLPVHTRWPSDPRGLLYVRPPYPSSFTAERLATWPDVIVFELPPFGEEPQLLLELRSLYPVERTRFFRVPPVPFLTAWDSLMRERSFSEAARIYIRAAGRLALMNEILQAGHEAPLRYRALYRAEARRLPREARLALERLSVCRGPMSDTFIQRIDVEWAVEELERRRWLHFDNGWHFSDSMARRSLLYALPPGIRRLYHALAEEALEEEGQVLAAAWHRKARGEPVDWPALIPSMEEYPSALLGNSIPPTEVPYREVFRGAGIPLLEGDASGPGLERSDGDWYLLRFEEHAPPTQVVWEPMEEDVLLRVEGELHVFAPLSGALEDRPPLEWWLGKARLAFAPVKQAHRLSDGRWLLPARGAFAYDLRLPAGSSLRLESNAREMALRLRITAYTPGRKGSSVRALDFNR